MRLNLQEHIERERAKDKDFVQRLERSLQRGEAPALVALFIREAAQATTEERMRMLAAAAAGVFFPDLDSEMRSRVARAVAQLEPTDVVLLRSVGKWPIQGASGSVAHSLGASRGALEASGCILIRDKSEDLGEELRKAARRGGRPELQAIATITETGRAVLRALATWEAGAPVGEDPPSVRR